MTVGEYDMWCPLCGDPDSKHRKFNFWKAQCRLKQAGRVETCYPTCKEMDRINTRKNVPETAGVSRHQQRDRKVKRDLAVKLLQGGEHTTREIAAITGLSGGTICMYRRGLRQSNK